MVKRGTCGTLSILTTSGTSGCLYRPNIRITGSRLPAALAGLFAAQRVYQTMSQGTGHPRCEDRLESREPYMVQLGGPHPPVGKVQMVLVTLP